MTKRISRFVTRLSFAVLLLTAMIGSRSIAAESAMPAFPVLDWLPLGHGGGGYHQVLTIAPTQPNRLYLCIDVGGIYRSDDGGMKWYPIYGALKYQAHHAQRVIDLAVSHQNPDVFYTITMYGGMWKSTDGGNSYQRVGEMTSTGGKQGRQLVVVNPADDNDAVFFASGQFHRTTDGGRTLTPIANPAGVDKPRAVAAAFSTDGATLHLYAGDETVHRSDDAGVTWTTCAMVGWPGGVGYVGEPTARHLLASRDVDTGMTVLFQLASADQFTIYRSDDHGDHWRPINMPVDHSGSGSNYYADTNRLNNAGIRVDPFDARRLAINAAPSPGHVSLDGGATWHMPTTLPSQRSRYMDAMGEDMHAAAMVFSPGITDRVYARTMFTVYRSDDGGRFFYVISQRRLGNHHYADNGENGVYVNAFATDPGNGNLYISDNDVGLARSEDFGRTWRMLRYPITEDKDSDSPLRNAGGNLWNADCFAGIFFEPGDDPRMYVWINQTTIMMNELESFKRAYEPLRRGRRGIYYSDNGGAHLRFHSSYKNFPHMWAALSDALAVLPGKTRDNHKMFTAVAAGIFRSDDTGRNWTCLNDNIGKSLGVTFDDWRDGDAWRKRRSLFTFVRVARTDPPTLYAATTQRDGNAGTPLPAIMMSRDLGETWHAVQSPIGHCWAIAVSPTHPTIVYAADRDKGVFLSGNGGKSWNRVFDLTHVTCIVPSRWSKDLVYVASDAGYRWYPRAGVFRSPDAGKTWRDITGTLPHLRIMHLSEDPVKQNWLYIGTRGGGGFMAYDFTDNEP